MLRDTMEASRICLDGDWSMSGVAERFQTVAKQISLWSNSPISQASQQSAAHVTPEIDLAGIAELDASGCQLLAMFIRNLRENGITPMLTNIPDIFMAKIHFLGFGHECNLSQ